MLKLIRIIKHNDCFFSTVTPVTTNSGLSMGRDLFAVGKPFDGTANSKHYTILYRLRSHWLRRIGYFQLAHRCHFLVYKAIIRASVYWGCGVCCWPKLGSNQWAIRVRIGADPRIGPWRSDNPKRDRPRIPDVKKFQCCSLNPVIRKSPWHDFSDKTDAWMLGPNKLYFWNRNPAGVRNRRILRYAKSCEVCSEDQRRNAAEVRALAWSTNRFEIKSHFYKVKICFPAKIIDIWCSGTHSAGYSN